MWLFVRYFRTIRHWELKSRDTFLKHKALRGGFVLLIMRIIIKKIRVEFEFWQWSTLLISSSVFQRLRHGRSFSLSSLSAPHNAAYHELLPCENNGLETAETGRATGQPAALCVAKPTLAWRTPPSQLFKNSPVQLWRRLQETRGCLFNPFLDPIIQSHFRGQSYWVCYWIAHAKKKGPFSPARSGNEAAVAGSSWHAAWVVFPEPRVVFRLNTVWKHCGWLARGARQS